MPILVEDTDCLIWGGLERINIDVDDPQNVTSTSQFLMPGGRGQLPTRGSHSSGRAQLGHPAPRTMALLLNGTHCALRLAPVGPESSAGDPTGSASALSEPVPLSCVVALR